MAYGPVTTAAVRSTPVALKRPAFRTNATLKPRPDSVKQATVSFSERFGVVAPAMPDSSFNAAERQIRLSHYLGVQPSSSTEAPKIADNSASATLRAEFLPFYKLPCGILCSQRSWAAAPWACWRAQPTCSALAMPRRPRRLSERLHASLPHPRRHLVKGACQAAVPECMKMTSPAYGP